MSKPIIDPKALCHFALIVPDIQKAAAEWARLMGVESFPIIKKGNAGKKWNAIAPAPYYRGDDKYMSSDEYEWQEVDIHMDGYVIELIQPEKGKGPFKDYYQKHGTGIHHIAFYNDRCDEFHDMLTADGYEYIVDTHNPANGDRWSVHDTEDVLGTNLCIKPDRSTLKE